MFQAPLGKLKNTLSNHGKGIAMHSAAMMMYQELFRKIFRYNATPAQGTLTITVVPSNGETFTIGNKTYTWQTTLTNVDGNIAIGGSLAAAQQNLIDAINLTSTTGGPGNQYAATMTEHSQVAVALAWVANTIVVTAKTAGVAGNSIATTETMINGSFDAGTLGTTRAGTDESDSDTALWSADISPQTTQNQSYANNGITTNPDYIDAAWTNKDDYNQRGNAGWKNSDFEFTPEVLAASASRKVVAPDHFNRAYKRLRKISPRIYTQKRTRVNLSAPFVTHGSNTVYKSIPLDGTRMAWLYGQAAAVAGTYLVISSTDANGILTFGTPVIVDTNQNIDFVDMALVNTDKILLSYGNAGATNFITTRTASISLNVITMNSGVQVAATAVVESYLCKVGTDKALLAWRNGANTSYNVVTLTGTVPSYGATSNITGSPTYTKLIQNGTDKAQSFYLKSSNCYTVTVTISGTSVSFGVELVMMNGSLFNNKINHEAIQVATDKFIWMGSAYDENANGDRRNCAFLTVSGTTSTVASTAKSGLSSIDTLRILTVTPGSDYYFIMSNSTSTRGKKIVVDTTANTLGFRYGNPDVEPEGEGVDYGTSGTWMANWNGSHDSWGLGGQNIFVQVGTKTFMMGLGTNSYFEYVSTDQLSLQVLYQENVIATLQCNYGFLVEPKDINLPVNDYTVHYKIKNNNAFPIYLHQRRVWMEME